MMRVGRFPTFELGHIVLSEQGANLMTSQTIPNENTGGHVRLGILCVALGAALGVAGTALAIDSNASVAPAPVAREDSLAARGTPAMGCESMSADGTERCLTAASIAPIEVVVEDSPAGRVLAAGCRAMSADGTERCLTAASIAPIEVVVEDSPAGRVLAAGCRAMSADGTERCLTAASIT
jgi:hypothetical protein